MEQTKVEIVARCEDWKPGDVVALPESQAIRLIRMGYAKATKKPEGPAAVGQGAR